MKWQNGRKSGNIEDRRTTEIVVDDPYFGKLTGHFMKNGVPMSVTPTTLNEQCGNVGYEAYFAATRAKNNWRPSDLIDHVRHALNPDSCEAKFNRFFEHAANMGLNPDVQITSDIRDNPILTANRWAAPRAR